MIDRAKAAKVGIFTFVAGALLTIVLVTFGGIRFWKHKDRYYVALADSVMGLDNGTQVYFQGIHVGGVAKVEIDPADPSRVLIAIDVERGTPIRTDTKAMINMAGITGLKVIDLRGGASTALALPPGATIPIKLGTLDKLTQQAELLADQTTQMVARTREILDGAHRIVEGTNQIVSDIHSSIDPKQLANILDATRASAQNLAHASKGLDELVAENRAVMKTTIASVAKTVDSANQAATEVRDLVHANQGPIAATLADIRQAARSFKDLARELREKPSRLMFSNAAPERKLP